MLPYTVPNSALQVTAASSDASPVLGQSYSMNCVGHKTLSNLLNLPSPQWYTHDGNPLGNQVQLVGPRPVELSSSEVVAQFSTLRTSHAGNYTCQASLSSPARTSPIIKTVTFGITIQRKFLQIMALVCHTLANCFDMHIILLVLYARAHIIHIVNTKNNEYCAYK